MTDLAPEVRLMDAIAADLVDNAIVPDCAVLKYREPRAVMPDDCPLLEVIPEREVVSPAGTKRLRNFFDVLVVWNVAAVDEAQTLIDDDELALQVWSVVYAIKRRALQWSTGEVELGIPEAYEVDPIAIEPFPYEEGLVDAMAVRVRASITDP